MPFQDTGWTMATFMDSLFGTEHVLEVAELVADAQSVAERLLRTPADVALRRALRQHLRELRDSADLNRWVREGDIAAGLMEFPTEPNDVQLTVHQVHVRLATLHRLVQDRLGHLIELNEMAAA